MRNIDVAQVTSALKDMCIEANHFLTKDMKCALENAQKTEKAPLGKQIIGQLEENLKIAGEDMIPICQDTGMAVVLVEIGQIGSDFDNMADRLSDNINELKLTMEHQDQFMGSFAHELKTPMTSIIGYADLLRSQSLTGEEAQEAANYIFSEGKRLESLSLKLLDLLMMKKESIKLIPVDMKQMIDNLTMHLQPVYTKKGIMLQSRCERCICYAEPDLFSSVLTNLLDNARKAIDNGGNIMIVGERVQGFYRIRVYDNGRGMPEEAIKHITEAFYRVDKSRSRAQGGAGLGLTLCKEVIELHGGTIAFASREGNGTCVTVTIREATL